MAGILISPRFDIEIRKRKDIYKKRHGSPNFRDVLRERCRARIKAKRGALFDKMRCSNSQELHDTLTGMLREEVKELTSAPLKPMEVMETEDPDKIGCWEIKEISSDEDQWLLDEYEKVLAEEEAIFGSQWEDQVICPLCELGVLWKDGSGIISCPHCHSNFPAVHCLKVLQQSLNESMHHHSQTCSESPEFALITDNLFLICDSCSCWFQIV